MTDLEDRIRDTLHDPDWTLPAWPNAMPRIRRAAARQRGQGAGAALLLLAAVAVPLALLPGVLASNPGRQPSASSTPSARLGAPLAPWATGLGGEVAFNCGDNFCLMRPDGTGRRMLAATFPEWELAWSPDGRRLAFRGYYGSADGDYAIYVIDADGCGLSRLAGTLGGTSPSWSPTGLQITFALGGINVINANGTGSRRLTSDQSHADEEPAWSAGNQIAFVRTRIGTSRGEIYTISPDGSGLAALTHGGFGYGQPSWSRHGRQIAFVALTAHSFGRAPTAVEVANADGSGMHRVSPRSWDSFSPTWTPGGKIVFFRQIGAPTATTAAPVSAYIVNPDGRGLRRLYPSLAAVQGGEQIAWGNGALPQVSCSRNLRMFP